MASASSVPFKPSPIRRTVSPRSLGPALTTYDYRNEHGDLLFQVVRTRPKRFFVRRPDGQGGWLRGRGSAKPILYNLPNIQEKPIVGIPEGEKDADRLSFFNFPSTTNPFGAGAWNADLTAQLKRAGARVVVIFEDNDDAGRRHARRVAISCLRAGLRVRIVRFPKLPAGADVSDWPAGLPMTNIRARSRELRRLILASPEIRLADLQRPEDQSDPLGQGKRDRPIREVLLGVPKGERNLQTARLAGLYLNQHPHPSKLLSFLERWNARNLPPLSAGELRTVVKSIVRRDRRAHPERWVNPPDTSLSPALGDVSELSDARSAPAWRIVPSTRYLSELRRNSSSSDYLWGRFLPKASVVMLVGEASAGKTIFLHRLAHTLARGEALLGISAPKPLRILHVDVESPASVERWLLRTIGPEQRWHVAKAEGKRLIRMLKVVGRRYDVIIVDSLQVAWPVNDENSNSEGSRQILEFVKVARKTGAAVIVAHNSGEGNPPAKFKARGATARVDRADVVLNFDELGEGKRRLKVVKSRFGNLNESIEFAFRGADLDYRLLKSLKQPRTKQQDLERRIIRSLRKAGPRAVLSRQQIARLSKVTLRSATDSRLFDRALKSLARSLQIHRPVRGKYSVTSK